MPDKDLQTLLRTLVARYGTQTALAEAIGLGGSRLTKVLKGKTESLSVLNCLKLAKVSGVSPSQILRAAQKSDVADLIENMYGPTAHPPLTFEQAAHEWPELSSRAKDHLRGFLSEVSNPRPVGKKKRSKA